MASDKISQILKTHAKPEDTSEENKFFLNVSVGTTTEHFLELRGRTGVHTCFKYDDITWFNYDPEGVIDIELNGFHIAIQGRGLWPLFLGIKARTVAWVKEADSEMQDHKGNETYIDAIYSGPTEMFEEKEEGAESDK